MSPKIAIDSASGDVAWDFGDFPYGLEFLVMPPAGHAVAALPEPPPVLPDCDADVVLSHVRALSHDGPRLVSAESEPSPEELFWFRWISGHQITFLIWRLMGDILDRGPMHRLDDEAVASLIRYTHGYSAMLLYTGSCPRAVYNTMIRPRMYHQHRGFSGTWAPDFGPVRTFFRGGAVDEAAGTAAAELAEGLRVNRDVHDDVAARLVPDGPSLLQAAARHSPVGLSPRTALLYDNFFMTLRSPVGPEELARQLLHRIRAASVDVSRHGLYPHGKDGGQRHDEVLSRAARDCEDRFGSVLVEVAEAALGPEATCLSTTT